MRAERDEDRRSRASGVRVRGHAALVTGNRREQHEGRRSGDHIVQLGTRADGTQTRWTFTEITADSFHWRGEALAPGEETWKLEGEFLARREA